MEHIFHQGLTRRLQNGHPHIAGQVDMFSLSCGGGYGDVNQLIVAQAYQHRRLTGHSGVNRASAQEAA